MEVVLSYINENGFQGICEYVHVLQMVMGLLKCDCRELKANRGRKGLETVSLTSISRSFAKREQIIEVVASRASIGPPENREKDRIRRKRICGELGEAEEKEFSGHGAGLRPMKGGGRRHIKYESFQLWCSS